MTRRRRIITTTQQRRIRELDAAGALRQDIADEMGLPVSTVNRNCLTKRYGAGKRPDWDRLRRILDAQNAAEIGMRGDLAGRFGLPHADAFRYAVRHARRMLARPDAAGRAH